MAEDFNDEKKEEIKEEAPSIKAPITLWLILLFISLLSYLLYAFNLYKSSIVIFYFILYPGNIIIPIIIGLIIGDASGYSFKSTDRVMKVAIFNSIYTGLIYGIFILIYFEFISYLTPSFLSSLFILLNIKSITEFIVVQFLLPFLILILSSMVFGILSYERRHI